MHIPPGPIMSLILILMDRCNTLHLAVRIAYAALLVMSTMLDYPWACGNPVAET